MKSYSITGMTCQGCIATVSSALNTLDKSITVSLTPPQVSVPENISLEKLQLVLRVNPKYQISAQNDIPPESSWVDFPQEKSWLQTYLPLFVIMGLIALVSFKEAYDFHGWMMSFMAGFFIVFGGFKLFDLKGFADVYQTYDIIAMRSRAYAYAYPFIEIALGFAFLFHYQMRLSIHLNNFLMTIGIIGAIFAIRKKQNIQCACLGTALKLPVSTVTLVEDVLMLGMGVMML